MNKIFSKKEMDAIVESFVNSQSLHDMLETIGNGVEDENGIVHQLGNFGMQYGEYSITFEKKS